MDKHEKCLYLVWGFSVQIISQGVNNNNKLNDSLKFVTKKVFVQSPIPDILLEDIFFKFQKVFMFCVGVTFFSQIF